MDARTRGKRAAVLMVTLGALLVVSILAISFVRLMKLERHASSQWVEKVRAKLLAAAGVERAIAAIRAGARSVAEGPSASWFYRAQPGLPAGNGVELDRAELPSLNAGNTADGNSAIAAAGTGRPYSGALSATHEANGDTFVLKVIDAASLVDLNMPLDRARTLSEQSLVRMLVNLSRALDPDFPALTREEAEAVVLYRATLPGERFLAKSDLLSVPGNAVTPGELERLRDFVTAHAWVDPKTVAPMDPALVPVEGALVHGRVSTGAPRRHSRSPINVNTAPPEVLTAVLAEIEALWIDEATLREVPGSTEWHARGRARRTRAVSFSTAESLARAIVASREAWPFATWTAFRAFLDGRVGAGAIDELQGEAILAGVDPNVDTHRTNPDEVVHRRIDKFDLVRSTTEFTFSSMGVFEIESMGRVTANGGEVVADARVDAVVEVYSILRHTTQSEFEEGTITTYDFLEPIFWSPVGAVITEEDLLVNGSPRILGAAGSVHSNSAMDLLGSTFIEVDATATGAYSAGPQVQVLGESGGGFPREEIPNILPEQFRGSADFLFGADGKVHDAAGGVVGDGEYAGFRFSRGTWSWNGGQSPSGVLYFEGHVEMASRTGAAIWEVTIVATGHISFSGTPRVRPTQETRMTLIAGTDVSVSGNPGAIITGLLYAGEQFDLGGNVEFVGVAMAKGRGRTDRLVTGNVINGSVIFRYQGDLSFPAFTEKLVLPTLETYPEPDARADGTDIHLSSSADYDGWIGLAPLITSRTALGPIPYRNRLLARWKDGKLDADHGGGVLAMVRDQSGPAIAPTVGAGAPGHLLPDGVYSEFDATGGFVAEDNVGPLAGTIAFWIKPSWDGAPSDPTASTRSHHLLALSRRNVGGTQSFQLAHVGSWIQSWANVTGFHFERSAIENALAERLAHAAWAPPGHEWTHVAIAWDFLADEASGSIAVHVNGVEMPGMVLEFTAGYSLTPDELLQAPLTPGNLLRLGERVGWDFQLPGTSAEATYDELISLPHKVDASWAATLHGRGRYYSGKNAVYVSPELSIPTGSELLWGSWTTREPPSNSNASNAWAGPRVTFVLAQDDLDLVAGIDAAAYPLGQRVSGRLRYRLVFARQRSERPFYASPVVDDVTLAYSVGARLLVWEES